MTFLSPFLWFFVSVIIFSTALFLFIEFSILIWSDFKGAPFVRSKLEKIRTAIELAAIKPQEVVVDLGSGDGAIVIEAARQGAKAVGVEINPFLVRYSRWRVRRAAPRGEPRPDGRAALFGTVDIIHGDLFDYPLNRADVVFFYLTHRTSERLREKLERELQPGARVVSNSFPVPGWIPAKAENGVFLYTTSFY